MVTKGKVKSILGLSVSALTFLWAILGISGIQMVQMVYSGFQQIQIEFLSFILVCLVWLPGIIFSFWVFSYKYVSESKSLSDEFSFRAWRMMPLALAFWAELFWIGVSIMLPNLLSMSLLFPVLMICTMAGLIMIYYSLRSRLITTINRYYNLFCFDFGLGSILSMDLPREVHLSDESYKSFARNSSDMRVKLVLRPIKKVVAENAPRERRQRTLRAFVSRTTKHRLLFLSDGWSMDDDRLKSWSRNADGTKRSTLPKITRFFGMVTPWETHACGLIDMGLQELQTTEEIRRYFDIESEKVQVNAFIFGDDRSGMGYPTFEAPAFSEFLEHSTEAEKTFFNLASKYSKEVSRKIARRKRLSPDERDKLSSQSLAYPIMRVTVPYLKHQEKVDEILKEATTEVYDQILSELGEIAAATRAKREAIKSKDSKT